MSEKTEKPTEKRKKEGKKEGQVVKSVEITSGMQLISILLFFKFFSDILLQKASALMLLPMTLLNKPFAYALSELAKVVAQQSALMLAIFGGMLMTTTVSAIVLQIGLILASKAIGLKGDKINPLKNLKQIFSLNSLIELSKSSLKVTLLTLIFVYLFYFYASTFSALPYCGIACALPVFSTFLRWMWSILILFYVVLGVADYAFQHHKLLKQQKMSKDEVKREHKETDGDPLLKQRQRELQREIQSGSLAESVKQSAVIVRNPTHIAVCLGYDAIRMPLPKVLEKGDAARAAQIITLAERHAIPVVENIPLARKLFNDVACGENIPETLFEPVAALLRMILKIEYAQ